MTILPTFRKAVAGCGALTPTPPDQVWSAMPRSRILTAALAAACAGVWLGCGGGSPTDIVQPGDVDVTLQPIEAPGPRSVGLELAAKSGRDVAVNLTGVGLEVVTGIAFELRFDADFLDFAGADAGGFFGPGSPGGAAVVENAPGELVGVAGSMDQGTARDGGGTLLTLRFRLRQLRDAESTLIFGVPESLVYGPPGPSGQHVFSGARLVTRIRPPE